MNKNNIDLIDQLGGTTATARAAKVPVSTVHSWRKAGKIPSWRVPALEAALAAQVPASHPPASV